MCHVTNTSKKLVVNKRTFFEHRKACFGASYCLFIVLLISLLGGRCQGSHGYHQTQPQVPLVTTGSVTVFLNGYCSVKLNSMQYVHVTREMESISTVGMWPSP